MQERGCLLCYDDLVINGCAGRVILRTLGRDRVVLRQWVVAARQQSDPSPGMIHGRYEPKPVERRACQSTLGNVEPASADLHTVDKSLARALWRRSA